MYNISRTNRKTLNQNKCMYAVWGAVLYVDLCVAIKPIWHSKSFTWHIHIFINTLEHRFHCGTRWHNG